MTHLVPAFFCSLFCDFSISMTFPSFLVLSYKKQQLCAQALETDKPIFKTQTLSSTT